MIHRAAAEIGAGLESARTARPIPAGERIHVVGAAGAAGAAAALHAHLAGAIVTGCDCGGPSPYTPPLEVVGIPLAWEHAADHVVGPVGPRTARLAVTKALTASSPTIRSSMPPGSPGSRSRACSSSSPTPRATSGQELIAIAGTHGKSTTTGWVVQVLASAGLDPSAFVGALLPASLVGSALASTVRPGIGPHFVVEADEYAGNFDPYRPRIGALTNADWDHPDVFADRDDVVATFAAWIRRFDGGGDAPILVANVGDAGVRDVLAALRGWPGPVLAVELVEDGAGLARSLRGRCAIGFGRPEAGGRGS